MSILKRNLSKSSRLYSAVFVCSILISLCPLSHSICVKGPFIGLSKLSALKHKPMCSFLGIPYAKSTGGKNRFADPMPADPATFPTLAVVDGPFCPQILHQIPLSLNEDCLVVNVYTLDPILPNLTNKTSALKPVIVYIHGGALLLFSSTSLLYSPDFLVEYDVIVVTLNYRLNALGFISFGTPECPGNMGLKDQNLALKWVRKNIKIFGGDPDRVTLMGESAGSWSTALNGCAPKSRGLFHQLIIQSPVSPSYVSDVTRPNSKDFAKFMGYNGSDSDGHAMCSYLKSINIVEFLLGFDAFADKLYASNITFNLGFTPFLPHLDGDMGDQAFLPAPLAELCESVPPIPIISGQNSREGSAYFIPWNGQNYTTALLNGTLLDGLSALIDRVIDPVDFVAGLVYSDKNGRLVARVRDHLADYLNLVVFTNGTQATPEQVDKIRDYYFNQLGEPEILAATDLYGDIAYYNWYDQLAQFSASFRSGKIWTYEMDYNQPAEIFKIASYGLVDSLQVKGTVHAADIQYNFYPIVFEPAFLPSPTLKNVITQYSSAFANFAKTGTPNGDNTNLPQQWQSMTPDQLSHQRFGPDPQFIRARVHEERRQFLERVIQSG